MEAITFLLYSEDKSHLSILKDKVCKSSIQIQLSWGDYLYLELKQNIKKETKTYIVLKYGDFIKPIDKIIKDYKPKMYIDYHPKINEEQKKLLKQS